jgi:hypothetical protein
MYALHTEMFPSPRHLQTPPRIISIIRTPKRSERHSPYPSRSRSSTPTHHVHFDDITDANCNEDADSPSTVTPPRFRKQSAPQSNTSSRASSFSDFEEEVKSMDQSSGDEDTDAENERRKGNTGARAQNDRPQSPASDFSSINGSDLDGEKLPKPRGEPGRPNAGGYNLQEVLNWDKKEFEKVKVCYARYILDGMTTETE